MKQIRIMKYEAPAVELLEVVAEQGFTISVNSSDIDYNGFDGETEL